MAGGKGKGAAVWKARGWEEPYRRSLAQRPSSGRMEELSQGFPGQVWSAVAAGRDIKFVNQIAGSLFSS